MGLKSIGPKPYAIAGIAAVSIMVISVIICVLFEPSWDFSVNSMCDFGVSENKAISILFNTACIISGILLMISGLGWVLFEQSKLNRIGGAIVMVSGVGLMAVGIFDKTFSFHQEVTILYAVIFIIAIAFVCIQDIIDRHLVLVAGFGVMAIYGAVTLFVPSIPYALTQVLLMGYVFLWYFLKSLRPFEPKSPVLRKIIGMD